MKITVEVIVEHRADLDRLVEALRPLLAAVPTGDDDPEAVALEEDRRERDGRVRAYRVEHPEVSRSDLADLFGITLVAVDRIISDEE